MAGYTFVNAYAVDTALTPAGKEQNSVDFFDTSLGIASISDSTGNFNFSGNDVSAIGIDIGGVTYNGWISRPIKSGGEVKGFYFWTDPDFTTLAAAQADGNTDGDGNPYDNLGFVLVVDQSYFDGLSEISSGIKSVGSSSDRVDTALNSLLVTNSAPVAIADTATAKETGGLNNDGASHTLDGTSPTGNVLSNDTDVNAGDTHSVTAAGTSAAGTSVAAGSTSTSSASTIVGQYGTLSIGADGTYKYVVNDSNSSVESLRTSSDTLTDTFTYKMADQAGATSTTTLTVTITGQNDTPTANADYNTAKEATTLATSGITFAGIAAAGNVLTNDTDKDSGDGKTLSGSSVSTTGSVSSNSLVWVTDPGAVATGKYIYINGTPLYDNSGLTTSAHQLQFATQSADHLTMTFNLTPSAAALALLNGTNTLDLYSNAGGTGAAGSVTTDFTMGGSATVSVASVAGIAVGAAVSGTGVGGGVTVTAVNNATETVTLSSAISITAGTSLSFGTSSISSSGTTFYGDHGTLVLKSDGSYTYTPKTDDSSISSGQSASDTFHYTMQDTAGATSSSTLTITVYGEGSNDPTATADTNSIGENTATVSKATSGTGLLSNDSSGTVVAGAHSVGSAAEVAIGTNTSVAGQYGTLTLSSDGTYTYTLNTANGTVDGLNAGQSLTDTFVYRDTNAPTSSGSAVSTLTITINGVDDNPLAVNDTATATEKSGLNNATAGYNPSGNVLANDTDVDNAASSLSVGSIRTGSAEGSGTAGTLGSSLAGSYGSVTLNANGTWSYTVDETNATVNALSAGSTLTDSFNYTVSDGSGGSDTAVLTVTIQGAADTLAMNSVFVNEASPYAVFQVTGVQGTPLTLALSDSTGLSANDTKATLGTDVANTLEYYNGSSWVTYSGSATIPSGGTLLVRVAINNDTTYEGNESFSLTASSTWSDASSATGIGTIGDEGSGDVYNGTNTTGTADGSGADDDRPTVSITSPTVTESAGYATFTVSLDHASTQAIHFTPTVSSGSATVGTDTAAASTLEYSSDGGGTWHTVSGAVEIAAGATSVQLRIAITDDSTYEGNESFTLATGYIADAVQNPSGVTGTATITDAADTPTISVADTSATEGTSAVFTVSLDHASTTAVSFTPTLSSGTATVGTDTAAATALEYSSDGGGSWHTASGAVTIAAGDTSVQLRIATTDDTTYEGSEAFTLSTGSVTGTVTNGTGASGTATIDDNDVAPTLAIDSVTVNEATGTATFTVTRSGATGAASSVHYATSDTTTTAGSDYTATSGDLTFAAGETTKTIDVSIANDTVFEGSEAFKMTLSGATGASITTAVGTGTIKDDGTGLGGADNDTPTISVGDTSITEGGKAVFTVSLDHESTTAVSFTPSLSNGTATIGTDTAAATALEYSNDGGGTWHTVSGAVTIAAGDTSVELRIATVDDAIAESNETFTIDTGAITGTVTNSSGATATATINDNDTAATLAVDSVTVNEAAGTATFTVTRSGATGAASSVDYATSDVTTTAGSDYTATSGTVHFAAGETTQTISVAITNDTVYEGSESFKVTLSNASGASITTADGTGTIKDDGTGPGGIDNDTPTISVSDTSATEGANAIFTVSLDHASTSAISFTPALTSGTATLGTDTADASTLEYSSDGGGTWHAVSGAVTIAAGDTSVQLRIATVDDAVAESNETFTIDTGAITGTVTNSTGATATATITDNDSAATLAIDSVTVNEAAGTAIFTVTRSGATGSASAVDYATSDVTTTAGSDYTAATGTLNFAAGETTQTISVSITNDSVFEGNESFKVTLSNASGASITTADGTGTIKDDGTGPGGTDDDTPTISVADTSATEGANAVFAVSLDHASTSAISFTPALTSGTATLGTDTADASTLEYSSDGGGTWHTVSGAVTIAAGDTSVQLRIATVDDAVAESNETFTIDTGAITGTVTNSTGATGTATINDNDSAPALAIDSVTVNEATGTATFTVTRSGATGSAASVDYATSDDTAHAGSDYTAASGTLNFAAGETTKTIAVSITNDTVYEGSEAFKVTLSNPTGATITTDVGTGTIKDDGTGSGGTNNDTPTISVANTTITEGQDAVFTVSLDHASTTAISFTPTLTSGTATLGTDTADASTLEYSSDGGGTWHAASGAVTIAAGDTSVQLRIATVDDAISESNETFTIDTGAVTGTVTNATGATATATIGDNDTAPALTIDNVTVNESDGTATFTVTRIGATEALTVDYATVDGTATAGSDYTATNGTLSFGVGDTTQTVTVNIADDSSVESDETYTVHLSNVVDSLGAAATITTADGTGTIQDNDTAGFTIGAISGDTTETGNTATFTIKLNTQPSGDVTITVASSDTTEGTITGGATLTFTSLDWDHAQTVTVKGADDTIDDGDIAYHVNLTAASSDTNYDTKTAQVDVTNVDNDGPPVISISDVAVNEADGTATFTVTRSGAAGDAVSVDYATVDGTAVAGSDYTAKSGSLSFSAGQTSQSITVSLVNDHITENSETFSVHLSNIFDSISHAESIGTADGTATITDDDVLGIAVTGSPNVSEGSTAMFAVNLTNASASDTEITLALGDAGDTADASDYSSTMTAWYYDGATKHLLTITAGKITLPAGETSFFVGVPTTQDSTYEGSESFTLAATITGGAGNSSTSNIVDDGTGTTYDDQGNDIGGGGNDDTPVISVLGTQGVSEGSHALFTVALTHSIAFDTPVAITLGALSDTASTSDYSSTYSAYYYDSLGNQVALVVSGSGVTLPAGVDTFYVSVDTTDDSVYESWEHFTLTASTALTGSASDTSSIADDGLGTFFDDKGQPTTGGSPDNDNAAVTVTGTSDTSEGSDAVFGVTLTHASATATEIALTLGAGADSADSSDYSSTMNAYYFDSFGVPQTLTITGGKISLPAGVTQFYVGVPTTQDSVYEGTETFTLSAAITGGASDSGIAGIVDDGTGHVYDAKGVATTGTIDDDRPAISVTALADVSEGSNAIYTVTLSNASTGITEIAASLHAPGDTTSSADYPGTFTAYYVLAGVEHAITITGGNIEVPAGVTSFYVKVPTTQDSVLEGAETLTLNLAITGGSSGSAAATIIDDGTGHVYDDVGVATISPGDNDTPAPPPPAPPPSDGGGGGSVPPPAPPPTLGADLDPTSDNGASHTDKITSIITPDFTVTAPGLLKEGQIVQLITPDGHVAGTAPVTQEAALLGHVDVQSWELDDGQYTFTARVLDASGNLVGEAPVHVTIVTDLDGVMPSVELAANGGDFNHDGIPDWQQNNVAQLPLDSAADYALGKNAPASSFGAIMVGDLHASAPAAAVALDNTAQLLNISIGNEPGPLPSNLTAESGVLNFSVTAQAGDVLHDMDPARDGLQTRVVIDLPHGVDATGYVKWDFAAQKWVSFMDDGNLDTYDNGATLVDTNGDGKIDRVVITLTDGQFGDADGTANGVITDPGMLVLAAPTVLPVYDVKLANGDHYYAVDANEAARMAQGTGNVFQGVAFDSLSTDQGGRQLLDNHNPYTGDWYFAVNGAAMPYACYQAQPGSGFDAAAAGQGPGSDYHLYLNARGITQLVTAAQADTLGLAAQGYTDRGAIFNTTATTAFQFNADGYLIANQGNQAVRDLVHNLALQFGSTNDAGFVEAVEQQYLTQVTIVGLPHGGVATAADVNAAFGTAFG